MHIATLTILDDVLLFVDGEWIASFYDDVAFHDKVHIHEVHERVEFAGPKEGERFDFDWNYEDIINFHLTPEERRKLGIKEK